MTELTKDGKRLAEALEESSRVFSVDRASINAAAAVLFGRPAAASLRLPLEGDASLRGAVHPEIRAEFEGHCGHLIRVFASGADFTSAATALAQFALDNRSALSAALARPQPEAKGPVAVGVRDDLWLSSWRCPDCRCHSFAEVDEQKPDGSFGPGSLIRCVNCKRTFPASTTPPAEAKTPDAGVGEIDTSLDALIDGVIRDYPVIQETLRRSEGITPTGSAGEDDTGVREAALSQNWLAEEFASAEAEVAQWPPGLRASFGATHGAPQPPKAETPAGVGLRAVIEDVVDAEVDCVHDSYSATDAGDAHRSRKRLVEARSKLDAALSTAPAARPGDEVERVRHVKRGSEYEVLGEAEAQVSADSWGPATFRQVRDGDRLTVYRDPKSGKLWCRFTDEFRDGRFVPAAAPEGTR